MLKPNAALCERRTGPRSTDQWQHHLTTAAEVRFAVAGRISSCIPLGFKISVSLQKVHFISLVLSFRGTKQTILPKLYFVGSEH